MRIASPGCSHGDFFIGNGALSGKPREAMGLSGGGRCARLENPPQKVEADCTQARLACEGEILLTKPSSKSCLRSAFPRHDFHSHPATDETLRDGGGAAKPRSHDRS